MKKTLAIILTAVMVLSMVITAIPFSASAEEAVVLDPKNSEDLSIGSVAEDYTPAAGAIAIDSAEKFIAEFDGYTGDVLISDKDYYLTTDITLPDDYWPDGYFAGTIDGCGYTINTKAPLFWALWPEAEGDAAAVVIKNLVINCDINESGKAVAALSMDGGAKAGREILIDNVKVTGSINGDKTKAGLNWEKDYATAGLLAKWYGGVTVSDVYIACEQITGGNTGGIIGSQTDGGGYKDAPITIKDVYVNTVFSNEGLDQANTEDRCAIGGIIAYSQSHPITIENANIYGTMKAVFSRQVGGMIGRIGDNSSTTDCYYLFKDCTNYATIDHDAGKQSSSYGGVGGMVGVSQLSSKAQYFIFENCVNYGDITASTNAGGLIGVNPAGVPYRVIGGANYGDITVTEDELNAGGIVGRAQNAVTFQYDPRTGEVVEGAVTVNNGKITAGSFAGGIIGSVQHNNAYLDILNVVNNGDVDGWNAGGIIGFGEKNNEAHFNNCVNNGDVYGANIGGIIGKLKKVFTLKNCTNNGDIIMVGTDDDHTQKGVGGIAGSIFNTAPEKLENLKNTGNIYSLSEDGEIYGHNVAGIVGSFGTSEWLASADPETWDQATFINCVNEGDITGAGDVAGIVAHGEWAFIVKDCVNEGNITGKNAAGIVVFGFVGNNLATDTVIENNRVVGTITGTQSGAAIAIAGEGLDIEDCLDSNVIYDSCNVNAYISNGSAMLTAQYPYVITNPNTGDNFVMGIVLSILAITAMGITAVVVLKKRVRN